jgi:hypothetical protein
VTSLSGLDEEVSDRDLAIIARDHLTDWKALRPFLGLSRPQEREISESCLWNYGKQKHECLEVWKEMKGKKATYQALIKAAEDAKAQSLTDSVRAILTSRQNTPPHHSEVALPVESTPLKREKLVNLASGTMESRNMNVWKYGKK